MTADELRARVDRLAAQAEAGEFASGPEGHIEEDSIRHDVLLAIAAGVADPAGLAAEALRTEMFKFPRWYE